MTTIVPKRIPATGGVVSRADRGVRAQDVGAPLRPDADELSAVADWLAVASDMEHAAPRLLAVLAADVGAEQGALLRPGDDGLDLGASCGPRLSEDEVVWISVVAAGILETRRGVWVRDVESDARCRSVRERSGALRAVLLLPLLVGGRAAAVVQLGSSIPGSLRPPDDARLGRLCDAAGRILEHVRDAEEISRDLTEAKRLASRQPDRDDSRLASWERLALRLADEANDPVCYIQSNLQRAGEYVGSLQQAMPSLLAALRDGERAHRGPVGTEGEIEARAERAGDDLSELVHDFGALLEEVRCGTDQLQRIGTDFREFALGRRGPSTWVDCAELMHGAVRVAQRSAKPEMSFEIALDELPPVRCQRLQVLQLLVELLEHGGEAIGHEGSVRLSARVFEETIRVEVVGEGEAPPRDTVCRSNLDLAREIAEDQGCQLSVAFGDGVSAACLTIPVDV